MLTLTLFWSVYALVFFLDILLYIESDITIRTSSIWYKFPLGGIVAFIKTSRKNQKTKDMP